jgi:hypothetical protein
MSKGVYNRNDNLLDEDGNHNVFDYSIGKFFININHVYWQTTIILNYKK